MRALLAIGLVLVFAMSGCLRGVLGTDSGAGPVDYVSAKTYTKWVIEVDTVEGMAAPSAAMDTLKQRLQSVANKPDGIDIVYDDSLPARGGTWSLKDVTDFSRAHMDTATSGKTAALHLMFLDGSYANGNVLGVTVSKVSATGKVIATGPIAIFSQALRNACSPVGVPPCFDALPGWKAVLVHEFGHAMGLVDNGIPMVEPHEASTCTVGSQTYEDDGHSDNQNSVMFCTVEQANLFTFFSGGPPTDFDAKDRADLCAAGGKC